MTDELENLVSKLIKLGGRTYSSISNGVESGFLGINDKGATPAYFILYPDGSMNRTDRPLRESDLKEGWTAAKLEVEPLKVVRAPAPKKEEPVNSITLGATTEPAVKGKRKKKGERIWSIDEQIYLSDAEVKAVTGVRGELETVIIDKHVFKKEQKSDGTTVKVAHAEYSVTIRNKEFRGLMSESVDRAGNKRIETFRFNIWRSIVNPAVLYSCPI